MKKTIVINKPIGLTPFQVVELFKGQNEQYKHSKISYAGRLDPMAEGLLLLLFDEENKNRKMYENLEKTYEFSMLLGISTDSYDLLGKIITSNTEHVDVDTNEIKKLLISFIGTLNLPYPPYSSRTVKGIPLFKYARENRLKEINIPERALTISSFELLSSSLLSPIDLLSYISTNIPKVQGDFRQETILKLWKQSAPFFPPQFSKFDFRITCTSGTYVRGIVHALGEKLCVPTVTYTIKRTRIGMYKLEDAVQLKKRQGVRGRGQQ